MLNGYEIGDEARHLGLGKHAVSHVLMQGSGLHTLLRVGSFALSRRKQGFESPRERQRNQILGTKNFAGVQRMSNKRVRTTMHSHGKFRGAGATLNFK